MVAALLLGTLAAAGAFPPFIAGLSPAMAACIPGDTGTAGDDVITCTAANPPSGGVNTLGGNDQITIDGAVTPFTFEAGDDDDTVTLQSGTTNGIIRLSAGNDTAIIFDAANFPGGINGGVEPVGGGDTLDFRTATAQTLDGNLLSGFEELIKEGAGTLTNVGTFPLSFPNGVSINGGTLDVGFVVLGFTVDMADDTVLTIDGVVANPLAGAAVLTGSSGVNRITVTNANTFTTPPAPGINGLVATGDLGDGADELTTAFIVNTLAGTLSLGLGNDVFTLNGGADVRGIVSGGDGTDAVVANIAGGATGAVDRVTEFETLTKTGAGTLTIEGSGASDFTTVTVNQGTLEIAAGGAISDVNAATVASGATMTVTGPIAFTAADNTLSIAGALNSATNMELLAGNDLLTLQATADLTGFTGVFDGGAGGADGVVFDGRSGTVDPTDFQNWEAFTVQGGTLDFGPTLSLGSGAGLGLIAGTGGTIDSTAAFNLTGDLATLATGTFQNSGAGATMVTVSGGIRNAGTIDVQDAAAGDTITAGGGYTGGGALRLDVDFTGNQADTLTIGGNVVAGGTTIFVADISTGAPSGEDILLVDVTGSTADGDFTLDGGSISIGSETYRLARVDSQWFLTTARLFSPQNVAYEAYPRNLQALNDMPTHRQRVLDRTWLAGGDPRSGMAGFWMRASGGLRELDPTSSTAQQSLGPSNIDYDLSTAKVELGVDTLIGELERGRLVAGVRLFTGKASLSGSSGGLNGDAVDGRIHTDAFGIGTGVTWYDRSDIYVDGQLQYVSFDSDLKSGTTRLADGNDGSGYAASVEIGRSFALGDGFSITPEIQYVFSDVEFDTFSAPEGEVVSIDDGSTSEIRIGATLGFQSPGDRLEAGAANNRVHLSANLFRRLDTTTQVESAGTALVNDVRPWRAELAIGGSREWVGAIGSRSTLYADIAVGSDLGSRFDSGGSVSGRVGFKIEF